MAVREGVAETLERVSQIKTRAEKVEELRKAHSPAMQAIVTACFNPNWVWLLPETSCPYRKTITTKAHDFQGVFFSESRKLKIYSRGGGYDNMNQTRREVHYQEWLESMDPDDAALIEFVRTEGKMPYKGLTENLFKEAYAGLFATWT